MPLSAFSNNLLVRVCTMKNFRLQVIGEHGVFFADLSNAEIDSGGQYWDVENVATHYLTQDDTININSWAVNFASWKSNMKGQEISDR